MARALCASIGTCLLYTSAFASIVLAIINDKKRKASLAEAEQMMEEKEEYEEYEEGEAV